MIVVAEHQMHEMIQREIYRQGKEHQKLVARKERKHRNVQESLQNYRGRDGGGIEDCKHDRVWKDGVQIIGSTCIQYTVLLRHYKHLVAPISSTQSTSSPYSS